MDMLEVMMVWLQELDIKKAEAETHGILAAVCWKTWKN